MRIGLITDIHAGIRGDSILHLNNQMEFYDEIFFPYLIENQITDVLILGDTFERRKYLNIFIMYVWKKKFFARFDELGIKVKMLIGNHDIYNRNTNEVNSITTLSREFKNISVVETPEVFDFDGLKIGMMSWINSSNSEECMKFIATADCRILCGHLEVNGFEMVKGHFCDKGFDASHFKRFEQVFSGHFHIISSDGHISYLGNPNQNDWGDYGLKKGFWILDTATCEREHILNPFTLYEKIMYSEDIDIITYDYAKYDGKIVRVYVQSFEVVNKKKLGLFIDRLGSHSYSVETLEVSTTGTLDSEDEEEIHVVSSDTSEMIAMYVDAVGQDASFDPVKLKGYFAEVYSEAIDKIVSG